MLNMNDPVVVTVLERGKRRTIEGVVVGRTVEQSPRYDVKTAGGEILAGVEADRIETKTETAA